MEISGAYSELSQDTDYSIKNAPLATYVEYTKDNYPLLNYTSQQDTIVGKEKAVRIEGSKTDMSGNLSMLDYLVLHNNEPYHFRYMANVNDYDEYLPEFEAMVRSVTFNN